MPDETGPGDAREGSLRADACAKEYEGAYMQMICKLFFLMFNSCWHLMEWAMENACEGSPFETDAVVEENVHGLYVVDR